MLGVAIRKYTSNWLQPVIDPGSARTDAVVLAPGVYAAGLVIGRRSFGSAGANAVQTVTVTGTPTGGTFRLAWTANTTEITAPINHNTTAAQLQTILEALPGFGGAPGNVVVTGGPAPGSALVITFQGNMAKRRVPVPTLYSNSLTGGVSPSVTIADTTAGVHPGGEFVAYSDSGTAGEEVARMLLKFRTEVDFFGRHVTGGVGVNSARDWSAPAYYKGYFRTVDLTGLDAAAITDLGKIVRGTAAALTNAGTILRVT